MGVLSPVLIFLLLFLVLYRIPFIRESSIDNRTLFILFFFKVAAGITLGMIANHYSTLNDYNIINRDGIIEYRNLINHPSLFFTDIFHSEYKNGFGGFFNTVGSYWNDLRNTLITKLLAFCNLISRGDFNSNIVVLNFIGFFGPVALFRVFDHQFPGHSKLLLFTCFLIPTNLFYTSCLHKDLFVFTALGLFIYALYFLLNGAFSSRRLLLLMLSFLCLLLMRNFLAIALIPATVGWMICKRTNIKAPTAFALAYFVPIIFLLIAGIIQPKLNVLHYFSHRQAEYLTLPAAHTQIPLTTLKPDLYSFFQMLPEAFNHGLLRPYLWESSDILVIFTAIELLAICWIPVFFFLYKRNRLSTPLIVFCFVLTLSMFLLIGYIVPNTHSIVRYRSIYLPLAVTPLMLSIFQKQKSSHISY